MSKFIIATNDSSTMFCVDDEDYEAVSVYRWYARPGPYAHCFELMTSMHRLVADRMGMASDIRIDHVNENGTDNRRCNLRPATRSQNAANRGKPSNNTSGYKGVVRDKKRWRAEIRRTDKAYHIGCFDTPEEAAMAYDIKARELFGEYAKLNFPTPSLDLLRRVEVRLSSAKQHKGKGKSIYYGVSPVNRRWRARIEPNGIIYHLGYFETEEAAARAVDAKILELGLKRRLNLPLRRVGSQPQALIP
jgi:hypothetical protein